MRYFFLITLLFVACQSYREELVEPTADEIALITEKGSQAAGILIKELGGNLVNKINDEGPVGALKFCNLNAMSITSSAAKKIDGDIVFKRVSDRIRNLANTPDQFERIALDYFTSFVTSGENLPEGYVQKIKRQDRTAYRYYKPLKINALCLTCHGQTDQMNSTVLEAITRYYPEDEATGYNINDFRGLVRVEIMNR